MMFLISTNKRVTHLMRLVYFKKKNCKCSSLYEMDTVYRII